MPPRTKNKTLNFEQATARLEEIVSRVNNPEPGLEEMIELGLLPVLFSSVPSMAFGIAVYVLTALAFYTVADRRGLKNPWLAWIPIINCWLLGSLSDQYRYVVKGENKSKRKWLIILRILKAVLVFAISAFVISMVGSVVKASYYGGYLEGDFLDMLAPVLTMLGFALPYAGITIAFCVVRYIALYDVYRSLDPDNAVLYLVLSILFSPTEPFFLFFSRNKDLGMPPRRQEPVYHTPGYIPQEYAQEQEAQMNFWDSEPENKDYL